MSSAPHRPNRPAYGRLVVGAASVCLAVTCLACGTDQANPPATPSLEDAASRTRPVVRRGSLQPKVLLTGELRAIEAAPVLVPRTSSLQLTIRWMEQAGDLVREGQKILELDDTQFQENLTQAQLALSQARSELALKQARTQLELTDLEYDIEQARISLQRAQLEASVPEDLRSRRDYRDYQLELARAELALAKSKEDLRARRQAAESEIEVQRLEVRDAQRDLEAALDAIDALTLRAPRDGILVVAQHPIDGRRIQVGDTVWVGLEVMSIPVLTKMEVVAHLSDVDDGKIAADTRARCTLDAYPDLEFEGRVVDIAPVATEQRQGQPRRSFRVRIALNHTDPEKMRPGMSVKAEILAPPVDAVLVAPRWALDLSDDPPRARLAAGGTAEVRLGPCNALECVIEDGLDEGTRLGRAG